MKNLFFPLATLSCLALAFPLSNLIFSTHTAGDDLLHDISDPHFKNAAVILQNKCIDCHSSTTKLPFYANFPLAKTLISDDVSQGKERFNLDGKFAHNGLSFSELDLARLEGVLYNNSMVPLRYQLLHWNRGFNNNEKEIIKDWIYNMRAKQRAVLGLRGELAGEPIAPLNINQKLDMKKVALGNQLFHDTRLSGDDTISCASCHSLHKGGTDQAASSTGIRGQIGPINAPTVFNAVHNHKQFWDGRAANLEEQAGGPVTNPLEMGATWDQVLSKLRKDNQLVQAFSALYPDGLTQKNILNAIATFEESLVTPNSKFDHYLRGDKNALTQQEIHGYELFKQSCISCHAGKNLGGLSFEKLGTKADYFTQERMPNESDMGRFNVTKNIDDKHKFKVPTLRNIAQTHPYFHNASAKTLEEAVAIMGKHQTTKKFSPAEIQDISAFLRTLTGEYEGHLLK